MSRIGSTAAGISRLVLGLLLAHSLPAQERVPMPASIEGIALNFASGTPIANVAIRLSSTQNPVIRRGNRGASGNAPDFAANTDSAGRFAFKDVPPGEYRLEPGTGYVYAGFQRDFPQPVFTVASGQRIQGMRLPIVALSSVTGRVL